jgi:4'-phosphopantetheinyl transferase EntD
VAHTRDLAALGIDAEPDEPLPTGVLGLVSLPGERDMLAALARAHRRVCWTGCCSVL